MASEFRVECRNEGDRAMPNYVAYVYRRATPRAPAVAILESDGKYGWGLAEAREAAREWLKLDEAQKNLR